MSGPWPSLAAARRQGRVGVRPSVMDAWLWRELPGPLWARVLLAMTAAAVALVLCFTWVYPAIAPMMPFNSQTVGQ